MMKKIILHNMLTLDGCVSGPNSELDWLFSINDEGRDKYVFDLYSSMGGILVGRETYIACANYWPKAELDESSKEKDRSFAHIINTLPKYVFSKSLQKVEWSNSTLIKGNTTEEVNKLKQESGKDLILIGGLRTVQSFIKYGLIDEYHLIVHPVVLGKGKRLFENVDFKMNMKLVKATSFDLGVVALHYSKS